MCLFSHYKYENSLNTYLMMPELWNLVTVKAKSPLWRYSAKSLGGIAMICHTWFQYDKQVVTSMTVVILFDGITSILDILC